MDANGVRNEAIGLMGCPLLVGPLGLSASSPPLKSGRDLWRLLLLIIIIITRSVIVSEMTKSPHRHYRRFRERMTEEMGLLFYYNCTIDSELTQVGVVYLRRCEERWQRTCVCCLDPGVMPLAPVCWSAQSLSSSSSSFVFDVAYPTNVRTQNLPTTS